MVGIISVVIGGHFGGGDHFDGGDHFGGGTSPPFPYHVTKKRRALGTRMRMDYEIFGACVKCSIFSKNSEVPSAAKRKSCSTNKTGKVVRRIGRHPTLKAKIDTEEVLTTS